MSFQKFYLNIKIISTKTYFLKSVNLTNKNNCKKLKTSFINRNENYHNIFKVHSFYLDIILTKLIKEKSFRNSMH